MIELIRTNDAVVLSFAQSLLRDAGIECLVADQNMSVLDGSLALNAAEIDQVCPSDRPSSCATLRDGDYLRLSLAASRSVVSCTWMRDSRTTQA